MQEIGGKDNVRERATIAQVDALASIEAWSLAPGADQLRWVGIAFDADNDPVAAFQRGCTAIERFRRGRFPVPRDPWSPERSVELGTTAVVFVFPDGVTHGDVERYIWERALVAESIGQCVENYAACLLAAGCGDEDEWKFRVLAFLHALPGANRRPNARERGERLAELIDSALFAELLSLVPADDEAL